MLTRGAPAPRFCLAGVEGTTARAFRLGDHGGATLLAFAPLELVDPESIADFGWLDVRPTLRGLVVSNASCYRELVRDHDGPWPAPVLCDPDAAVASAYGVEYRGGEDARWTGFLVDAAGSVRRVWRRADKRAILRGAHRSATTEPNGVRQ